MSRSIVAPGGMDISPAEKLHDRRRHRRVPGSEPSDRDAAAAEGRVNLQRKEFSGQPAFKVWSVVAMLLAEGRNGFTRREVIEQAGIKPITGKQAVQWLIRDGIIEIGPGRDWRMLVYPNPAVLITSTPRASKSMIATIAATRKCSCCRREFRHQKGQFLCTPCRDRAGRNSHLYGVSW